MKKTMKNTFTIRFSPEAIVAMADDMFAQTPGANQNDLLQMIFFLSQPLRFIGVRATLDIQMGPWLSLAKMAKAWGWNGPDTPAAAGALRRLTAQEARRLADALRRAVTIVPFVPNEVKVGLDGLWAICDSGEVQIEHPHPAQG
jgi:hypothetical protein